MLQKVIQSSTLSESGNLVRWDTRQLSDKSHTEVEILILLIKSHTSLSK